MSPKYVLSRFTPGNAILVKDTVLCAFIKLEMLKRKSKLNHFALKAHLYLHAVQSAFDALRLLQSVTLAA
jgi:hypothetical protein